MEADFDRDILRGNVGTLILATLSEGPQHGYTISKEIERRSVDLLKLRQGTLYPALQALEREGFVAFEWETATGRARKVYRVTELGMDELTRRREGWNRFASGMANVFRRSPDASEG